MCTVDEIDTPFALDMRAAVVHVIGKRMRVTAKPEVNRARISRKVLLERLRLRLVADEIEV